VSAPMLCNARLIGFCADGPQADFLRQVECRLRAG
jgi:hypothetical protein